MKNCPRCNKEKSKNEFGKNAGSEDGLQGYCRDCMNEYAKTHRKNKPEGWVRKTADSKKYEKEYREKNPRPDGYEKLKYERKMRRLHGEGYVVGSPDNRQIQVQRVKFAKGDNPVDPKVRRSCRRKVQTALKNGSLVKLPCMVCGSDKSEAHHADYDSPLSVVWLCAEHHRECHPVSHVSVD